MGSRKQDYREVVGWLRLRSWRVDEERGGYPMAYCPPPCERHQKTIHKSPSNPKYYQQLKSKIKTMEKECQREANKQ